MALGFCRGGHPMSAHYATSRREPVCRLRPSPLTTATCDGLRGVRTPSGSRCKRIAKRVGTILAVVDDTDRAPERALIPTRLDHPLGAHAAAVLCAQRPQGGERGRMALRRRLANLRPARTPGL